jgi:hypothetical protein
MLEFPTAPVNSFKSLLCIPLSVSIGSPGLHDESKQNPPIALILAGFVKIQELEITGTK